MKKNKLVNIVLIVMIVAIMLLVAKDSFAATSGNIIDITNTITGAGNNTARNNVANNTANNTVNNTTNNTTNNVVNNTTNNTVNNKTNNTVLKTNNTSNYNNTSLPDTGIEDSIAGVVLVVVLAISGVYAYNKIQYYRDI